MVVRARALTRSGSLRGCGVIAMSWFISALPPIKFWTVFLMVGDGRSLLYIGRFTKYGFAVGAALAGSGGPARTRFADPDGSLARYKFVAAP